MTDDEVQGLAHEAMQRGDFEVARRLLIPLADRNSGYALTSLGWMYQNGHLGPSDRSLARKYYERAIAADSLAGYLHMGLLLMSEKAFTEARSILEEGSGRGSQDCNEALKSLASEVNDNLAFEAMDRQDYQKAFAILQNASGSEYSLTTLGWLYQTGSAGVIDKRLASSYYQRAAEIGGIDAHYRIGMLEFSQKNMEAARTAFEKGAKLGHMASMSKLGQMLVEGQGGSFDFDQGMKLLERAAKVGHIMSKIRILRIEIAKAEGIIKKTALKMRFIVILKDAIIEVIRDRQSLNLYEFT